ncbi:MAG: carboxypeptidase regulatory-like domain-containing protein [Blastocatellales bacterium]
MLKIHFVRLAFAALIAALCFTLGADKAFAQAQGSTGQITGTVRDNNGGAVPGATVTAANTQNGFERQVSTSADGVYRFVLLQPGIYKVSATAQGFSKIELTSVSVTVGQITDANITLGVGAVAETVTVTAESLQTTTSNQDAFINESAISNLPINGRRFQDFVTLTPTAQVDPQRGQISLSGQRGIYGANINIDGMDYNQPFFGGIRGGERSNNAFTIPQESIREFQVVASGYSAEFGRSTGGVVTVVTKSGTNQFHGSGFYLNRHQDLAAKNAFDQDAAPTQHQFGGSIGGPIRKDKAFFFGSYEQQILDQPRAVFFDRLTSFTPSANSKEAFDYYKSLETPFQQTNDARAVLGRFDYQFNEANRFNVRYNYSRNEAINANATGNSLFPTVNRALSNNGTEGNNSHTVVGQLNSFFSSNLVNELRGQYSREARPRLANAEQAAVTSTVGTFGTRNFLPTTQFDWRVQVFNNLTWIMGNHSVKFGAEVNHLFIDQTFAFNQFGEFSVSGSNIESVLEIMSLAGSTANRFDTTAVTYRRNIGNGRLDFTMDQFALFAQDAWRVRPNFTLNYGLRWEGQSNPAPDTSNTSLYNQVRGFRFPSGHMVNPSLIPDNSDQFGPRVGFAWDPFSNAKTVIRGFGGVYYASSPGLLFAAPLNNFRLPPGDLSIQLPIRVPAGNLNNTVYKQLKLIGIDLNNSSLDKLPILTPQQMQSIAGALGLSGFDPFTGAAPITWANDFKNPKSYQWGGGVEHQLANGLTVGVDYSQVNTVRLQRNRELNIPTPLSSISEMPQLGDPTKKVNIVDPAQRPFYGLRGNTLSSTPIDQRYAARQRPIPTLGSIQVREATGRAVYQGMTVRTNLRRKWGQFSAFYTLSRSLSNDDNERDAGGVAYQDVFNFAPEFNYSRLDTRHQFVANPVFFLPYEFEVSAAIRLRSGRPIDASFGSDRNEDIGGPDRPYSAPGVPFKRNAFRNRAVHIVDFRVQKGIKFGERARLTFSAEFFNLPNLDNIEFSTSSTIVNYCANPVPANCGFSGPTNPNFLQIKGANGSFLTNNNPGNPFQAQFGARFQF